MTDRRARTLALVATCALACARPLEPLRPAPLSVVPGQSTGLAAQPVEISGRDLAATIRTDFSSSLPGSVDATFRAALEPAAGDAVPLQGVTLTPSRTLRATVPAGLRRGPYRLRVTDPRGRETVLERAFRIVTPAEAVTGFRVDVLEAPHAGVPFNVALTAVDAQGLVVDTFDGSASLTDDTGALSPVSTGAFVAGRAQVRVTIFALATGDRLTAADGLGRTGASDAFDVVAGPAATPAFPRPSVVAAAGACSPEVDLELRDALGHPAVAGADVSVQLQAAPPEVSFFSDAGCTARVGAVTVAAGASRASFRFRADAAGIVTLRAVPAALPSATQDETVSP